MFLKCQLHQLLAEKGMSLRALALETGIHYNTLRKLYLQEAKRVDLDVIATLCAHLGCGIEQLFTLDPSANRKPLPKSAKLQRGRIGGVKGAKPADRDE